MEKDELRTTNRYPIVSIIIPVFNDERRIVYLLESINKLRYPKELYEVIIVDNGSTDKTRENACKYNIRLLREDSIKSSYAARNKGILNSKGEIIAFTDSDCILDKNWLINGVSELQNKKCNLLGGRIKFFFRNNPSGGELYDSLMFMQNELYVKNRKAAATANLFVRANLFKTLGLFPVVKSGGDGIWTKNAVRRGASISYSPYVVVYHPARKFYQVVRKCFRVGKGGAKQRMDDKIGSPEKLIEIIKKFIPSSPRRIRKLIRSRGEKFMDKKIVSIWTAANISKVFTGLGLISGYMSFILIKNSIRNRR